MIVNPPFQAPDEDSHLFKAYGITQGSFNFKKYTTADVNGLNLEKAYTFSGQILPSGLIEAARYNKRVTFKPRMKTSFEETRQISKIPLNKQNQVFIAFPVPLYSFVSYLPSALVIWILGLFNAPPFWLLYAGRLCSLFVFCILGYFAIKITPVKKWLFFAAALMPMTLYEAGAMSTDALINGLSLILCAYIFYLAYSKTVTEINKKEIMLTMLLSVLLAVGKFVYLPLVFLFLLIPSEKFNGNKSKVFSMILFTNLAFALFVIFYNILLTKGVVSFSSSLDTAQLLKWAVFHPFEYLEKIFLSVFLNFREYLHGITGIFGWNDTHLPDFAVVINFVILAMCSVLNFEKKAPEFSFFDRLVLVSAPLASVFLIFSVFYLLFMPDEKTNTIVNVQGRYFILLLPMFLCAFANSRFNLSSKFLPFLIVSGINFVLFISFVRIFYRFYI